MIQGVIFDMDGTLSDTQKLHARVESDLLRRFGIILSPEEITKRFSGIRTKDFFGELLKNQRERFNLDELMSEKWKAMERLASKSVEELPGATKLVKRLHAKGLKMAVATASRMAYTKTVLKNLGLNRYFEVVVCGDMVSRGKPDPESFLLSARQIGIEPEFAVVIEDGVSGMEAARAAGMKCVGLVSDTKNSYPTKNLVTRLGEITDDFLENLA